MSSKSRTNKSTDEIELLRSQVRELRVLEEKHALMEGELKKRAHELELRLRELNCLYGISSLLEEKDVAFEEILAKMVNIIFSSGCIRENICTRIIVEDRAYSAGALSEPVQKIAHELFAHGNLVGVLEVYVRTTAPEPGERPLIERLAGLIERIIEQKKTETALLESEKRFRSLVEYSPTGIFIIQDQQVVYENPEERRISGPLARLFREGDLSDIHPEDVEKVKVGFQRIVSGLDTILDMDFRFFFTAQDGSDPEMKWVHCRANLIQYGGKHAVIVNKLDVTRAKELEILVRTEDKMASLGRIASGMAHEIRNPLSGINIYLSNLEKIVDREDNNDKAKEIIGELQSASNRIESVIKRVVDFSRPSEPKLLLININEPIQSAVNFSLAALRKSGIIVSTVLADDLPLLDADPHLIEQVILNLITNAKEAMKNMADDKVIRVMSSGQHDRIIITISDTGPGVPSRMRNKVFDPFYTTKSGNTGIGLSLCKRIVADHGGTLVVDSNEWGGAAFRIELPVAREKETGKVW